MAVSPFPIYNVSRQGTMSPDIPMESFRIQTPTTIDTNSAFEEDFVQPSPAPKTSKLEKLTPVFAFFAGLLLAGILAAVGFSLWLTSARITTEISTTTTNNINIFTMSTTTTSTTTSTTTVTSITTTTTVTTNGTSTTVTTNGTGTTVTTNGSSTSVTTHGTSTTVTTATTSVSTMTTATVTTTTTTTTTTIITPTVNALWNFDGNTADSNNNYNSTDYNAPVYVTGYNGRNQSALSFNGSLSQYVSPTGVYINLTNRSFTVELWFYPTVLTAGDYGLFGQCQTTALDLCLIYMIRNYYMLMSFYSDDTVGVTPISINRWYHVAFVYDYPTSVQSLYLNGYLEHSRVSNSYQGTAGDIFIGAIDNGVRQYFTGYIDQVSLMTRSKNAAEILIDASLVCYYSFDSNISTDSGPLGLTASSFSVTLTASNGGRVNRAISLTPSTSYFFSYGFTRLGIIGQAFSISLWIKPTSRNGATIVYVTNCNQNCSSPWCLPFIGFTSGGQIAVQSLNTAYNNRLVFLNGSVVPLNSWTHVVQTYSSMNGLRLFINGNLVGQTQAFIYLASGSPNYIYIGDYPLTSCFTGSIISQGQYHGLVDEFYVFSRDLTLSEVSQLANP